MVDEVILLGLGVVVTVAVPALAQRLLGAHQVLVLLGVPQEPGHLVGEDDVLHQLPGLAEHRAVADDALETDLTLSSFDKERFQLNHYHNQFVIIKRLTFLLGVGLGSVLNELRRLGKCAQ